MKKTGALAKKVIIISVILVIFSGVSQVTFARAGHGGGGGGGGGSSHHSSETNSRNKKDSIIGKVFTVGVFGSTGIFLIYRKIQQRKQMKKSILDLENLQKIDENWDWTSIRQDVEDTFYKVQIAWTEMNQDIARDYVSDKLYHKHKNQIEEMRLKNHRNIIVDMSLLDVKPMGVTDYEGINNDSLWVCIKARAIDYTINEDTNYVLEGDRNKYECFEEYWRFVRRNDKWVLDEIKQIAEINNMDFFN